MPKIHYIWIHLQCKNQSNRPSYRIALQNREYLEWYTANVTDVANVTLKTWPNTVNVIVYALTTRCCLYKHIFDIPTQQNLLCVTIHILLNIIKSVQISIYVCQLSETRLTLLQINILAYLLKMLTATILRYYDAYDIKIELS